MKLTVFHAEHRCEPCRDMHGRIDQALAAFALATGLDASSLVEYVNIDASHDWSPPDLSIVPCLIIAGDRGVYFRSDGRVPSDVVLDLLAMMAEGVELPRAAGEEFDPEAPSAAPVFYRTYSRRRDDGSRETWEQMVDRCVDGIADLGRFTEDEHALVWEQAMDRHALPSGRWLWVGGTEWIKDRRNFSGAFNCSSTTIDSPEAFGYLLELAMMGSGTGAVLEDDTVAKLPPIARRLELIKVSPIGKRKKGGRDDTRIEVADGIHLVKVGDSRQGWVDAYQAVIDLAMAPGDDVRLIVDLSQIRPIGAPLKGFGGRANPVRLPQMFERMVAVLNQATGRQLTPMEACLLIDEGAACIVAGNIRRSAGMRQFSAGNEAARTAKLGLYVQDEAGTWKVDPEREALRMANHTRVFHHVPTLDEVREAVALQFSSGEGAIQFAPEALARANADLLPDTALRDLFLEEYAAGRGRDFLCSLLDVSGIEITKEEKDRELDHRMLRYGLNPCGEIIGKDFMCNLGEVHLNTLDSKDLEAQDRAFRAAALEVAALLQRSFPHDRYHYSREIDPIVGVSFTGLFDFFVQAFGVDWLQWFAAGRPEEGSFRDQEAQYLAHWRTIVDETVAAYCGAHGLLCPNRCTTVQPAGTKSLLTGASSGWHPPKAARFIRRITFGAHDPVALAAIDAGYSVVPSQSCRDDDGNLLDDPFDPRATEWLVEIPTAVTWADLPGADQVDLSKLPATAQFDFYMVVQQHYTAHNTSATIELREEEIEPLAQAIHGAIGNGYISAALLARFDVDGGTFPRLPFEPISRERYQELHDDVAARHRMTFRQALELHDRADLELTPQEAACTSGACIARAEADEREGKG